MTAAFGALGAKSAGGTTGISVATPAGAANGDLLVLARVVWLNSATLTTPSGWTLGGNNSGGTGTAAGAHTTRAGFDWKWKQTTASEPASISCAQSGSPSGAVGIMARYTKAADATWDVAYTGASVDTGHGANRGGGSTTGTVDVIPGDILVVAFSVDTDADLGSVVATYTIGTSTTKTLTRRTSGAGVATGLAGNVELFDRVCAETESGTITAGFSTGVSQCGAGVFLRIREVPGAVAQTVNAPTATGSAAALVPDVAAGATVEPGPVAAAGQAVPPAVSSGVTVEPPPATASGQLRTPDVSSGTTSTTPQATATAAALPPTTTAGAQAAPPAAAATAAVRVPSVTSGATVAGARTTAAAAMPAPTVTAGQAATISPPPATATAQVRPPTVQAGASVAAPTAAATATTLPPTATAGVGFTIAVPPATASAAGRTPTVTAGATVGAPTARATSTPPAPSVEAGVTVDAGVATAVEVLLEVEVQAGATVDAPPATATVDVLPPTLDGVGYTIEVDVATALAQLWLPDVDAPVPPVPVYRPPPPARFAVGSRLPLTPSTSRISLELRPRLPLPLTKEVDVPILPPIPRPAEPTAPRVPIQTVTVRGRVVTGTDDDDNAVYGWVDLMTARAAIEHTGGVEVSDVAGHDLLTGTIMVDNPGRIVMPDTIAVIDEGGQVWRVISTTELSEAVLLQVEASGV